MPGVRQRQQQLGSFPTGSLQVLAHGVARGGGGLLGGVVELNVDEAVGELRVAVLRGAPDTHTQGAHTGCGTHQHGHGEDG
jgi:hypothetical protein